MKKSLYKLKDTHSDKSLNHSHMIYYQDNPSLPSSLIDAYIRKAIAEKYHQGYIYYRQIRPLPLILHLTTRKI
jgi:hypothetical protein